MTNQITERFHASTCALCVNCHVLSRRLRGLNSNHVARVVTPQDGKKFDYIMCMDNNNVSDVKDLIPGVSQDKICLLGTYDPDLKGGIINDPYYSSSVEEFERVFEICERACKAFLDSVDFDYV